eukprot:7174009-Lingulodinium_polyedra.AAC.1
MPAELSSPRNQTICAAYSAPFQMDNAWPWWQTRRPMKMTDEPETKQPRSSGKNIPSFLQQNP